MNEKRKITLKDIAKELKLSPSTVSRALNGYPSLSEETIQLVKKYAAKHQYVPNTMAVNFRKNRTSILGMIVPQIVHHFFSTTISGALEAAKKRGYSILLAQSYDHLKEEILASQYLLGMGVDGVDSTLLQSKTILDPKKPNIHVDNLGKGQGRLSHGRFWVSVFLGYNSSKNTKIRLLKNRKTYQSARYFQKTLRKPIDFCSSALKK